MKYLTLMYDRELEEDYYTKVVDKFSSEGQRDSDDSDEGIVQ